jgi:hypothetical protein
MSNQNQTLAVGYGMLVVLKQGMHNFGRAAKAGERIDGLI